MLVRHDAAREISFFRERGALSARLFGCRFSRIITVEKSKIGSLGLRRHHGNAFRRAAFHRAVHASPAPRAPRRRRDVMEKFILIP
jgi:hypothetical protein